MRIVTNANDTIVMLVPNYIQLKPLFLQENEIAMCLASTLAAGFHASCCANAQVGCLYS